MWTWLLLLGQSSPSPVLDPGETAKAFGIAAPVIGLLSLWLRASIKERDAERTRADRLAEQRLDEMRQILPLAHSLAAIAERIEAKLR